MIAGHTLMRAAACLCLAALAPTMALPGLAAEEGAKPKPKRVLILGDSISIDYTPHVRAALGEEAVVVRPMLTKDQPESCEGATKGVASIDRWLALDGGRWDVIHFNFGLHDLKRVEPGTGKPARQPNYPRQAEPDVYGKLLAKIVMKLKATGAKLVFATTTPVPEGSLNPYRSPLDPIQYNTVALQIMKAHGIAVNDLNAFAAPNLETWQRPENVHFNEEGSKALGEQVAKAIRAQMKP